MLKFWGRRSAFNVQKAIWMIGEVDLEHEHIDAGGDTGGLDEPAFRKMNPHGRIPVIDDGGLVIWESNSIIRYLAAKYGGERLWDPDPATRSLADRWLDWGLATGQRDFLELFWGYYRTPEQDRDAAYVAERFRRCADN